ncbi:MAG: exodeoxyribonuclease VII large subunit [Armatimonadetes bacterium]|nr:exodeoxyribonuclease VII large subunit [Armatimonadota bacterium]MDW8027581.1 exodeoxyribonuclease VII large subunit [Armatimonadota bacterium]
MEFWTELVKPLGFEESLQEKHIFTVTEINSYLREKIHSDELLQGIWVRGEISQWKVWQSGNAYFTIKDEQSQIGGVMWRERLKALVETPQVGEWVRVFGSIRVPKNGGKFEIDAITIICERDKGFWWQRYEETKRKLQAKGLFDEKRKRNLPTFPERIGIVTSLDAAALRDMVRIAKERHAGIEIVIFPALVQGDEAPISLVRAIQLANSQAVAQLVGKLDVLIVGRGGGSIEDLWAFNEEKVVQAVAESLIPTVSAVGHESDTVLTDFAADFRAPTPTAAAQKVVPDRKELLNKLQQLQSRMQRAVWQKLRRCYERLLSLSERRCLVDPLILLSDFRQSLDSASMRLESQVRQNFSSNLQRLLELSHRLAHLSPQAHLERWRERLKRYSEVLQSNFVANLERRRQAIWGLVGKLEALNPYSVLQRGYALVRDPATKRVFTRAANFTVGQNAELVMADGILQITVDEVRKDDKPET